MDPSNLDIDDTLLNALTPPIHYTIQAIVTSILDQWHAMETNRFTKLCSKQGNGDVLHIPKKVDKDAEKVIKMAVEKEIEKQIEEEIKNEIENKTERNVDYQIEKRTEKNTEQGIEKEIEKERIEKGLEQHQIENVTNIERNGHAHFSQDASYASREFIVQSSPPLKQDQSRNDFLDGQPVGDIHLTKVMKVSQIVSNTPSTVNETVTCIDKQTLVETSTKINLQGIQDETLSPMLSSEAQSPSIVVSSITNSNVSMNDIIEAPQMAFTPQVQQQMNRQLGVSNSQDFQTYTLTQFLQAQNDVFLSLKSRVIGYVIKSLKYLAHLRVNNPRIRAKREKMRGLAFYLQECVPEFDWEWTHRIIIDLDRFGIFDIETMASVPSLGFRGRGPRKVSSQPNSATTRNVIAYDVLQGSSITSQSDPDKPLSSNHQCQGDIPSSHIVTHVKDPPTSTQILIVGAGASGITAAIRLRQLGYNPIILEARHRIGGRVYTRNGADIGATIMTGGEASPIYHWCKALNLGMRRISDQGKIYRSNGDALPYDFDMKIQEKFNELLDESSSMPLEEIATLIGRQVEEFTDTSLGEVLLALCENYSNSFDNVEEREEVLTLLHWHIANLEYGIGCDLRYVNLRGWDLDDGFETRGFHFLIHGGVQQVFIKMSELHDLDIRFGSKVTNIDYSSNTEGKVQIHFKKNEYPFSYKANPRDGTAYTNHSDRMQDFDSEEIILADKVLVTIPLSLLQNRSIEFTPPLPDWKRVNSLGLGTLNKVILFFNECFWTNPNAEERDFYFGQMSDSDSGKLKSAGYLVWDVSETVGEPCLMSLVPGSSAIEISTEDENIIVQTSMDRIRRIFPNAPQDPKSYFITNWKEDQFSQGCYAYVANGSHGIEDYDTLAKEIDRKIYFGGEHTMGMYSATVLGATLSGMREAGKMDCHFALEREARGERNSGTNVYKIYQLKRTMRDLF